MSTAPSLIAAFFFAVAATLSSERAGAGRFLEGAGFVPQARSRQVVAAVAVVLGLATYAIFGDPASGNNAPNDEWAVTLLLVAIVCGVLSRQVGRKSDSTRTAAAYGIVAS